MRELSGCSADNCPGIWVKDETDEIVVRGQVVAGLPLSDGEQTVKIPAGMLAEAAERLRQG
jgi:predicted aconitase with swiveling domain